MNSGPAVIVNKSGFFTALVKGVFGLLIVIVICATALGLFAMRMADKLVGDVTLETIANLPKIVESLPEWRELPPFVAEALNDHRDLAYRDNVEVATRLRTPAADSSRGVVAIEVTNQGKEVISYLTLRLLVEDEGPRAVDRQYMVATPISCGDSDMPGPLAPGEKRTLLRNLVNLEGEARLATEVTDLRVWDGPVEHAAPAAEESQTPAEDEDLAQAA